MAKEIAILIDLCAFIIPLHLSVYFDDILKNYNRRKNALRAGKRYVYSFMDVPTLFVTSSDSS